MNSVEQDAIVARLDSIILNCAPDAVRLQKYGGTLYTLRPDQKEGQFCGVFVYRDHVQLAFSHGASLPDEGKLLTGTGKYRRHINFSAIEDVTPDAVGRMIAAAVASSTTQDMG